MGNHLPSQAWPENLPRTSISNWRSGLLAIPAENGRQSFNGHNVREWKPAAIRITIVFMLQIGLFAMHVLEVMFFVGMAGSAVVVVISFVEDAQELFGED